MQVSIGHIEFVGLVQLEAERIVRICREESPVLAKPKALKTRVEALKKLCDQWPDGE